MTAKRLRVAIVPNAPAPYRHVVYELIASDPNVDLRVIFCSGREPDREWDLVDERKHILLKERVFVVNGRFIHFNLDILSALRTFRPEVVITTGFNPTHLIAYAYSRWCGAHHVVMTDGTFLSEQKLSFIHRWVRKRIFSKTNVFIGASDGAFDLFRSYGITNNKMFKSHLCADNVAFFAEPVIQKKYDFIFCGRFVALKNPFFALKVAQKVAQRLGRPVSMIFVGSGELDQEIRAAAAAVQHEVRAVFSGFALQKQLPQRYRSARLFLFPTKWEPWGVVANEACAAGVPVLISDVAVSARELVRDGENGFVLPLVMDRWADAAVQILTNDDLYNRMSARCCELVKEYTYENAAKGIVLAINAAKSTIA